jgi:hypothetical protein
MPNSDIQINELNVLESQITEIKSKIEAMDKKPHPIKSPWWFSAETWIRFSHL